MDENIKQYKIKKLIKSLDNMKGNGTSLISLIIRPNDKLSEINSMLTVEMGTATNIKSRVNRLSVLSAITSAQQRLKLYNNKTPNNGLIVYCGNIMTDDGKEKKINIDFEPFKAVNRFIYHCGDNFRTEILHEFLKSDDTNGFIIIAGDELLLAIVSGTNTKILYQGTEDLPKKHRKGGQSSARFGRIRLEKRHNYITKATKICKTHFIGNNEKPIVDNIILGGFADFKQKLYEHEELDYRLKKIIVKPFFDTSHGGNNGLKQTIELSASILKDVALNVERRLLSSFYEEIAKDSNKYAYGMNETIYALEEGLMKDLIIWENLEYHKYDCVSKETKEPKTFYAKVMPNLENYEILEDELWIDYITEHYNDYGANLHIITDSSQEGTQFCQGFGGVGGILRYESNLGDTYQNEYPEEKDDSSFDEDDFI